MLLEENENLHAQMSTLRSETNATEAKFIRADLDDALDQLNKEQTLHTETSSLLQNTRDSLETTENLLSSVKLELAMVMFRLFFFCIKKCSNTIEKHESFLNVLFYLQGKDKIAELSIQCDNLKKSVEIKQNELEDAESVQKELEGKWEGERALKGKLEKDLNTEKEQVDFLKNQLNKVVGEKEEVHNSKIFIPNKYFLF